MTVSTPKKTRLSAEDRRALLEDAALACIARGGIRDFTVDKIAAEAGVSRGLITHHFGSMELLLVAIYSRMYSEWMEAIASPIPGMTRLEALVEALVSPAVLSPESLNIWITLWGEVATNPVLRDEHRMRYADYRAVIATALQEAGVETDLDVIVTAFICLIDGLGIQRCVEPDLLPDKTARAICWALLTPHLAPSAAAAR